MAILGSLTGGLSGGSVGSAAVHLLLDTSQFDAGLARAQGSLTGAAAKMDAIGRRTSALGGTLTRGLSVPLVAAGAAATKMALDFNSAFVKIQTLGGKTGQSLEQLKSQVLDLAEATGQDPTGLANALYQVSSAGKVAASQAMPILTSAAQGAAVGMGDVNDIAHLLTSTMNAYGPSTISAGEAMDVLSQATKDSAAEADALSSSLGPVIGVAAQIGVSFQDVAAAIATATNQGISAERAATGLRFLLQSLAAPTQIAQQKLQQYGVSAQDLQRMLSSQGLQGTLQTLANTFDLTSTRGQQAWKAVVGGARGAVIANTQVGDSAQAASDEVASLTGAAGAANRAFTLWGQTITGKNAKALGSLKAAAIKLGTDLIPIFESIVHTVSGWVDAFNRLSPSARDLAVKIGLLAVALGPVLKIGGSLISVFARLSSIWRHMPTPPTGGVGGGGGGPVALPTAAAGAGEGLASASVAAAGLTVAVAALIPLFGKLATDLIVTKTGMQTTAEHATQLKQQLDAGTISTTDYVAQMRGVRPAVIGANDAMQRYVQSQEAANKPLTGQAKLVQILNSRLSSLGGHLNTTKQAYFDASGAVGDYKGQVDILQHALDHLMAQKYGIKVTADTSQAHAAVQSFLSYVNNSSARVDVTGTVVGYTRQK